MKKPIFIFVLLVAIPSSIWAQGNAFSFQGRLNDGSNPANGAYDLEFRLFPSMQGGTQIAPTASRPNTTLINGVFGVTLDFGATAFANPNSIYIEIGVRQNGSPNAYTILGPRQQLTVVPFAVRAMNATNADNATNAQNAQNALNAGNALNATNANHLNNLVSEDFIRNSTSLQEPGNFNVSGTGTVLGNFSVGRNGMGNFTVAGDSLLSGKLSLIGSTAQNRDQGGFVKAMVYVDQFGVLVRCFNGLTGSSTGNCGGILVTRLSAGSYRVDFPFQVNDRFIAISPGKGTQVNLIASFQFSAPNLVDIVTNIADVSHNSSFTDDDFMLIVY